MYEKPRFLIAGDSALIMELSDTIEVECSKRIRVMMSKIEQIDGVKELVPAYSSIMVCYDPSIKKFEYLVSELEEIYKNSISENLPEGRTLIVPVRYGGEYGPDLGYVSEHAGLTEGDVIEIHTSVDYFVYFIGFMPGFPYLGGMDERIATPRLDRPRDMISAGSVGIAGSQTGIYPLNSPGGWRIIGRTPTKLYDPCAEDPVIIKAGGYIRFRRMEWSE